MTYFNPEIAACSFCSSPSHFKQNHVVCLIVPDEPVDRKLVEQVNELTAKMELIDEVWDNDTRCKLCYFIHPSFEIIPSIAGPWRYGMKHFVEHFKNVDLTWKELNNVKQQP